MFAGEKMTDEEVNELLMGQEDAQGNVNYEGVCLSVRAMLVSQSITFETIARANDA